MKVESMKVWKYESMKVWSWKYESMKVESMKVTVWKYESSATVAALMHLPTNICLEWFFTNLKQKLPKNYCKITIFHCFLLFFSSNCWIFLKPSWYIFQHVYLSNICTLFIVFKNFKKVFMKKSWKNQFPCLN